MVQHLCYKFESSLENELGLKQESVMEGKTDGQAKGPPNF